MLWIDADKASRSSPTVHGALGHAKGVEEANSADDIIQAVTTSGVAQPLITASAAPDERQDSLDERLGKKQFVFPRAPDPTHEPETVDFCIDGTTSSISPERESLATQRSVFDRGGTLLDCRRMGTLFKGLARCGAWGCSDEPSRIAAEVLSGLARLMISIQNGLRAHPAGETPSRCNSAGNMFEASFITMHPGYAWRTGLPDEPGALFWPATVAWTITRTPR